MLTCAGAAALALLLAACPASHKLNYPACAGDTDCHAGEHCVNHQCMQCAFDSDCPAGQVCEGNVCKVAAKHCTGDSQCPAGTACIEGICKPCAADTDCGPGGECNRGACTRAKACKTDDDCPPDKDCINGLCIGDPRRHTCQSNADCPQGQECDPSHHCVPSACQLTPVYFDFDSATIPQAQLAAAQADGQCIAGQTAGVVLEGHTDPAGTEEYNLGLSDRRARAVESVLTTMGIDGDRFRILPMGEAGTSDSEGDAQRAKDRRVEVKWQ